MNLTRPIFTLVIAFVLHFAHTAPTFATSKDRLIKEVEARYEGVTWSDEYTWPKAILYLALVYTGEGGAVAKEIESDAANVGINLASQGIGPNDHVYAGHIVFTFPITTYPIEMDSRGVKFWVAKNKRDQPINLPPEQFQNAVSLTADEGTKFRQVHECMEDVNKRNKNTSNQKWGAAIPTFVRRSELSGRETVLLVKDEFVYWTDVHKPSLENQFKGDAELGSPRMIQAHRWATNRAQCAAGFPNFENIEDEEGMKYGIRCLKDGAVLTVGDLSARQLGNPKTYSELQQAVARYVDRFELGGAFANMECAIYEGQLYYGVVFLRAATTYRASWGPDDYGKYK